MSQYLMLGNKEKQNLICCGQEWKKDVFQRNTSQSLQVHSAISSFENGFPSIVF